MQSRKIVRLALTGVTFVLIVVAVLNIETVAQRVGWDTILADKLGGVMPWLASAVSQAWFPWLVFGMVCFTMGLWTDNLLRWRDAKAAGSPERLRALGESMIRYKGFIYDGFSRGHNNTIEWTDHSQAEIDVFGETRTLLLRLYELGIQPPRNLRDVPRAEQMLYVAQMFSLIGPLLRDGHLKLARQSAKAYVSKVPVHQTYDNVYRYGGISDKAEIRL